MTFTRRELLLVGSALGAAAWTPPATPAAGPARRPRVCMGMSAHQISDERLRFMQQIGLRSLFMWGPGAPTYSPEGRVVGRKGDPAPTQGPWIESELRAIRSRVGEYGLEVETMMLHDFRDAILGRPGRDAAIDRVIESIRVAGRIGLPVVEYNWYALRAQQGYYRTPGRGGVSYLAYDVDRTKDLPPLPDIGEIDAEELWGRYRYFLEAVIPVAEESGVRMCVHPNDPPAKRYRGVPQILASLTGIQRLAEIIPRPANGVTLDTGVMREWGEDPVEVIRWFGRRDQINHVHFRNVITERPGEAYREVFLEEGDNDMAAAMRALLEVGYDKLIYPDHVPRLPDDPGARAGWALTVGRIEGLKQQAAKSF